MKQRKFLYFLLVLWCIRAITLAYAWIYPWLPDLPVVSPLLKWGVYISAVFTLISIAWMFLIGTYNSHPNSKFVVSCSMALWAFGFYGIFIAKVDLSLAMWLGGILIFLHYSFHFFKKKNTQFIDILKYATVFSLSIGGALSTSNITALDAIANFLLLFLVALQIIHYWNYEQDAPLPNISEEEKQIFE